MGASISAACASRGQRAAGQNRGVAAARPSVRGHSPGPEEPDSTIVPAGVRGHSPGPEPEPEPGDDEPTLSVRAPHIYGVRREPGGAVDGDRDPASMRPRNTAPTALVPQQAAGGLVRQRSVTVPGFTGDAGDGEGSVHRYLACRGVEWGFQCRFTSNLPFPCGV